MLRTRSERNEWNISSIHQISYDRRRSSLGLRGLGFKVNCPALLQSFKRSCVVAPRFNSAVEISPQLLIIVMTKKRKLIEATTTEPSTAGRLERNGGIGSKKEGQSSSSSEKGKPAAPKVVSSNWMQLQSVGVPGPSRSMPMLFIWRGFWRWVS